MELMIPQLLGNSKTKLKDKIIQLLSIEWPLSLRKIHNRLRERGNSETYQAVFKVVKELTDMGVLKRYSMEYAINLDWLKKTQELLTKIEKSYSGGSAEFQGDAMHAFSNNQVTKLTFKNMVDMDKFWLQTKNAFYHTQESKNDISIWCGNHCWWLLVYPELEHQEMQLIKNRGAKHYVLCCNDTPLDRWADSFYSKLGSNYLIKEETRLSDIAVFGDMIMQVQLPSNLKRKIDKVFNNSSSISDVDIANFISKVINIESEIQLTLTHNRDIANSIRSQVLESFKEQ